MNRLNTKTLKPTKKCETITKLINIIVVKFQLMNMYQHYVIN